MEDVALENDIYFLYKFPFCLLIPRAFRVSIHSFIHSFIIYLVKQVDYRCQLKS